MSLKALADYTFYSRYASYIPEKKQRETWEEAVHRVFDMHKEKYAKEIEANPKLLEYIEFAQEQQIKKRVLASQRSLQFAKEPILKHNLKMFNCLFVHIDRERVFQEIMYSLLCGCGVGFSVQKQHVAKIGNIIRPTKKEKVFQVQDSIEGWADAIGVAVNSWFENPCEFQEYNGHKVEFDFSLVRPEGSLIAGRFIAPGPEGLSESINKVYKVLESRVKSDAFSTDEFKGKLRPIDTYDMIMHISDAVLSGGVRRSATLALFSHDDNEMMNAKIGNWFIENPQRGRSNNSAALLRGSVTREEFSKLMKSTRQFGEPGFIWTSDLETGFNPCSEINLYPKTRDGRSGWQSCNLTEINGKYCSSEENFINACIASAIIGTLQAGYTDLKYLEKASEEIFKEEALLGCSITGLMDNPEVLFDPKIQKKGAKKILEINEEVANMININPCARATCIKPAGSTSCVLSTASGIHPHHAKRYIRRVQVNRSEFCGKVFKDMNPIAVEKSVWSANGTDNVISFLCEVPAGSITKNQLSAIELLEKVKITQQNWVEYGTNVDRCIIPTSKHCVSNTITVKESEWDELEEYIYKNQKWFAGISLLPESGDLDYAQAPFSTVLTPTELVREYGDASVFASGLIVDGLAAFNNNLWRACDTVMGYGDNIVESMPKPEYPTKRNNKDLANYFIGKEAYDEWFYKKDWIRRVNQFAVRYFNGDVRKATYCMKHVSLWKTWCDLSREYKDIDWSSVIEENETYFNANEFAAVACAGGKCELGDFEVKKEEVAH